MEEQINELKETFNKIVNLKNYNEKNIMMLDSKTRKLKTIYDEFIKNNKDMLFVFSLDSLYFQGKIIDIECDDMKRFFSSILNRIYCEFFKLHKFIVDYIKTSINDKKIKELLNIHNDFPIYNDLEPFKVYDFEIILNIHAVLLELLTSLSDLYSVKDYELKKYQTKNKFGFDIDNFVNTILFNNTMIREKIQLFINYLSFFHKLQLKYLTRYSHKIELVISQIDLDIDFEEKKISEESNATVEDENVVVTENTENLSNLNNNVSIYNLEYNSGMSSTYETTSEVVENTSEISNSKRKKNLAKKKRSQQKKMENKKEYNVDIYTSVDLVYTNDTEVEKLNTQLMSEEDLNIL